MSYAQLSAITLVLITLKVRNILPLPSRHARPAPRIGAWGASTVRCRILSYLGRKGFSLLAPYVS